MSDFFMMMAAWRSLGPRAIPAPSMSRARWWDDGVVRRAWLVARVADARSIAVAA